MKTIYLILTIICINVMSVWAQVPDNITQKFKMAYPEAGNVKWKTEKKGYKATYHDAAQMKHSVYYDNEGNMTKHEYQVVKKEAPAAIYDYCSKYYPQETISEVWVEEDKSGNKTYYITHKQEVLYFDNNGNYIKKTSVSVEKTK